MTLFDAIYFSDDRQREKRQTANRSIALPQTARTSLARRRELASQNGIIATEKSELQSCGYLADFRPNSKRLGS